ncbi:hypothetical protein T484DRAFT_1837271, partial [Baffinella frigidus]
VLASITVSASGAYAAAVGITIATVLLFLLVVFFARRILEASRAVAEVPTLLVFPLTTLVSLLLLLGLCATSSLYLASAGRYDPVLGAYTHAATLAFKGACADDIVEASPLSVVVDGKTTTAAVERDEAERLCVVAQAERLCVVAQVS